MLQKLFEKWRVRLPRFHFTLRRYEVILIASVMLLSGAVIPSSWEPPVPRLRRPHIQVPESHPLIALTFDDGPHPVMTEKLLAVLKKEHVPGTFFVVGKMADRYPQLVREMVADGNEVANHTYSHTRLPTIDNHAILDELDHTRTVIRRITGKETYLFRPPGGEYTRRTLKATSKAGYRMVLWSVLTNDFRGVPPHAIYHRVLNQADDGGIVLMHSGMKNTLEVLPQVIAKLRERGYQFVTVSTLWGLPAPDSAPKDVPAIQTASIQHPHDFQ